MLNGNSSVCEWASISFRVCYLLSADGGGTITHHNVWVIKLYNTRTHACYHLVSNRMIQVCLCWLVWGCFSFNTPQNQKWVIVLSCPSLHPNKPSSNTIGRSLSQISLSSGRMEWYTVVWLTRWTASAEVFLFLSWWGIHYGLPWLVPLNTT